jgi:hypothetical protein
MADQNIGTITLEEALIFIASERFRNIKRRSSGVVVMDLTFVMELLLCLAKRRKPDIDFKRAKN